MPRPLISGAHEWINEIPVVVPRDEGRELRLCVLAHLSTARSY